jgi:beta-N-acetylhexosaminidase
MPTNTVPTTPRTKPDPVHLAFGRMTLEQRVGQLFMVGTPATGIGVDTLQMIRDYHVGSVVLSGRSYLGRQHTAQITATLQSQATASATAQIPLFIATDQEGGEIQVLHGPGFSDMPTAVQQGSYTTVYLRTAAQKWGTELSAAGVNVDLGPVLDTVPVASAGSNPPIAGYGRQFGNDPIAVAAHGTAVVRGLGAAGVDATVKHFPGLGRVNSNPDNNAGVTDDITTRNDPFLTPFATAIRSGAPLVMMSTAIYRQIDPSQPAAFSRTILTGMLRGDLRFAGVVISDDLGRAAQVQAWTPGERAERFISSGGDLVLTVEPSDIPTMTAAVLSRTRIDATFAAQVSAAVLRVLNAKHARRLL